MRLPKLPHELPRWPPLLASRGPGELSTLHAHHAMHLIACLSGELKVRAGAALPWQTAPGLLSDADAVHAVDASGCEVLIVFLEPESRAGRALRGVLAGPLRLLSRAECDAALRDADPLALMGEAGAVWSERLVAALGGPALDRPAIHPRVRELLQYLSSSPAGETSLAQLARRAELSPGRLMHAFTESIGIPLRPYVLWLRTQRAAAALSAGAELSDAAYAAGFADAAHMARTFRRTFGMSPSLLRRTSAPRDLPSGRSARVRARATR